VLSPKPASVRRSKVANIKTHDGERSRVAAMVWLCHDLGYCSCDVDHDGWVAIPHSAEEHDFSSKTLEEGLAWCRVWLMAPELGSGSFLV
jgi:hypothetical protein